MMRRREQSGRNWLLRKPIRARSEFAALACHIDPLPGQRASIKLNSDDAELRRFAEPAGMEFPWQKDGRDNLRRSNHRRRPGRLHGGDSRRRSRAEGGADREAPQLGGTCLHVGCIPTKALLFNAEIWDHLKHAAEFGLASIGTPTLDWAAVLKRKDSIITKHVKGLEFLMKKNKVDRDRGYWQASPAPAQDGVHTVE